jgi:hypothetical protein
MKGFIYPRFILNKQSFIATNSNFRYISLLVDLLQQHPEMFVDTSTTLLYILNLGTNYKPDILFDMFKNFIYSDFATLQQKKAFTESINTDEQYQNIIIVDTIPILFTYYLLINKVFKPFEPSMALVEDELKLFLNNPTVYYEGKEYRINELKPLFYNLAGFNFTEFLIYYAYVITYLIYGAPYQFYNEIGTASAAKGMLTDIDQYFESCLKLLTKETQIPINSFNAAELYSSYISSDQIKALQGCLNKMLSFEEIIKLRNREMNKTAELLDENYMNQNQLQPSFIKQHFLDVMDKLIKIAINENPFVKVINRIPSFTPLDLIFSAGASRPVNFDELMDITGYCISGGDKDFVIDESMIYHPVNSNSNSKNSENSKIFIKQQFKTNINVFKRSMKQPFSDADVVLRMLQCYIRQKFLAQQDSFLDTPDIGMDVTEPIKIDHTVFTEKLFNQFYNNFITGYYFNSSEELEIIIQGLLLTNPRFKEEYEDIKNMWIIASKIYKQIPKAMVLSTYLMSFLKESIDMYIKSITNTKSSTLKFNFDGYLFMNYLTHFITSTYTEECERKIFKMYDSLIAYGFCVSDEYARLVNICEEDFEKHLMNSILQHVYISGNTDLCELYSIGGTTLYSKMLDINPFNRGYEFIKDIFGTSEDIENVKKMCSYFKEPNLISLIEETDSRETIYNVMKKYIRDYELRILKDYDISHFTFKIVGNENVNSTDIIQQNGRVEFEPKLLINILNLTLKDSEEYIFEYLLSYAFKQITGNYHDNEFRSKELKISENGLINVGIEKINKIEYTDLNSSDKHSLPVSVGLNEASLGDNYTMPVLRYIGDWENMRIKFSNPIGTKLIKFDLRGNNHDYNMCIMMFTSAKLDSRFNIYG